MPVLPDCMGSKHHNPWLARFAVGVVLCTLLLIGVGGLVTSKEVGMAVFDWPTTLGHHMFLVPLGKWIGQSGIFEEHSHRLIASIVGLLTAILTGWIWARETTGQTRAIALTGIVLSLGLMGVRTEFMFYAMGILAAAVAGGSVFKIFKNPSALRWWGMLAYSMVIVQGVFGGLRVTQINTQFGIFHGTLAQVFLLVLGALALFNSRWWKQTPTAENESERVPRLVRTHFFYASILIFLQLVLGATMRHQHAGLPIWDFPAAHGQVWPNTSEAHMADYNKKRDALHAQLVEDGLAIDKNNQPQLFLKRFPDITAKHIHLHMSHRVLAVIILLFVIGTVFVAHRRLGAGHALSKISLVWLGLTLAQATLGALTVLQYKPATIATLHVLCGALTLLTGAMGTLISRCKHLPAKSTETLSLMGMKEANS